MPENNLGNPRLRSAVRLALGGGTLVASFGVANAQEAVAPAAADTTLAEVVVTGSRIAAPNAVSISPVTFVSSVDIQQSGQTQVADILNQLPQVFADQGSSIVNGGAGTETVNLRGLNAKRTLVLVNGFRLGYGDPRAGFSGSDINAIPAAMIDSVEVLTGGASSVYGADAVAGVVNFKLNDHFEGVKLVANGGIYTHSNNNNQNVQTDLANYNSSTGNNFAAAPGSTTGGATEDLTFIAGLNSADGNGNATVYANYRHIQAVVQSKYSYSACTFASGYVTSTGNFTCSGSSTAFPGRFTQLSPTGKTISNDTIGPGNVLIPFTNAARYNYGPLNYYMTPDQHYTAGAFMHYDFNEHATVYFQTTFMDDRQVLQIAPSGAFYGNPYTVNCANPFLSPSELTAWCGGSTAGNTSGLEIGRRNVEGGNRQDDVEHTDWREVLGVKGKINDAWDYDANFQYGLVNLADTYTNDVSSTKINYALDVVVPTTGANAGKPTCAVIAAGGVQSGLGLGCVPWNIFQLGGVTPAATGYINTPGLNRGQITQQIVHADATGDLGKYGVQLPWASSGLKVNIGAEWKDVYSQNTADEEFADGDLAGQGGAKPSVQGGIVNWDGFAEARMPILEDMPFAKALDVETGYRYSTYQQGWKTNTYKFGVDWAPIQDVRFRGSFQRAVRAPNVIELYSPQSVTLDGNTDPCAGAVSAAGTVNGYTAAQCAKTGVQPGQFGNITPNSASQYNGLTGGNPTLNPETALTTSIGIQLTPSFVPNLRVNIDYFDIKIENVIETVGADTILKECLTASLFCNDIHRNAIGSLWIGTTGYVTDALANVGQLEEKGADLDIAYSLEIGKLGKLHFGLTGTYLNDYTVTPIEANGRNYNCAGYYGLACSSVTAGAGTPVFRWRHIFRTTWSTPWEGLDVTVAWRYFAPVQLESLSYNPLIGAANGATVANGGISNTDVRIPSYNYLDLSLAMKVTDKISFRLGVNNMLDKSPPVIGTTNLPSTSGNGNTFPQVYDWGGRYIFGQAIVQF
jgi:iron complex outermembrane receptor protein